MRSRAYLAVTRPDFRGVSLIIISHRAVLRALCFAQAATLFSRLSGLVCVVCVQRRRHGRAMLYPERGLAP